MAKRTILGVCLSGIIAVPAMGMADTLTLKNGDRLSGKLVSMTSGKVTFETSYAGLVTIDWSEVSGVETDQAVQVVFEDDSRLNAQMNPAGEGKVSLEQPEVLETTPVQLAAVRYINPPAEVTGDAVKLKGYANLGLNMTDGNTETGSPAVQALVK